MSTISPRELARRARVQSLARISEADARTFLEEWAERGIAREVRPGEWALTRRGRAKFSGWAVGIEPDDGQHGAT